jgi:hypothetical protein
MMDKILHIKLKLSITNYAELMLSGQDANVCPDLGNITVLAH